MATGGEAVDGHHARLMSMLKDLVGEHGPGGAAEILEVDRRTMATSMERGRLSRRMRAAVDRVLLAEGASEAAGQQGRLGELEKGLETLADRLDSLQDDVRTGTGQARAEIGHEDAGPLTGRQVRELARRVASLERAADGPPAEAGSVVEEGSGTHRGDVRPGLVTDEPHPGEEEFYGAGMALVAEWRALRRRRGDGARLEQTVARERIMELEVAMLGEHGLTLPPETEPLHPSRRAVQLDWRMRELADLRVERRRAELLSRLRRALTLGLWKG